MKVRYCMNTAYDVLPKYISPPEHILQLGIKYKRWEGVPIADCIMLYGVVPETVPNPVPIYLAVIEEGYDNP